KKNIITQLQKYIGYKIEVFFENTYLSGRLVRVNDPFIVLALQKDYYHDQLEQILVSNSSLIKILPKT
ncbi:MAG: hypothetical protein RLZ12_490, partial [Bacillota bacterium]